MKRLKLQRIKPRKKVIKRLLRMVKKMPKRTKTVKSSLPNTNASD